MACGPMPTAPRLGRRHSSDAVCQGVAGPHVYADGLRKPTVAVGVYVDRPTAVLCRRVPSAYLYVTRRPLYADGQNQAVGISPKKPTGAVGIVLAVGVWPCSGSGQQPTKEKPPVARGDEAGAGGRSGGRGDSPYQGYDV